VRFDADSVELTLERLPGSSVHPEAVEFMLGAMTSLARRLTGGAGNPVEIHFTHEAPRSLECHERFFRCPVRFGATKNALSFDSAVLSLPAVGHDPDRCRELERTAAERLSALRRASTFRMDLASAIHREIETGEPTVERTAAVLGLHPKTMARRLRSEGTSFSEVLEEVRLRLARQYLDEPGARVTEVAFRLGYSEKSAFNRAFKRWTGEAPERYRRKSALS
jgi:AraC-like DNA-binding protein